VHGLLVRDNDDEALASQVISLLEHPAYARALAAAAHQTCVAYEWPLVSARWLAVYQSVRPALEPHRTMTAPADSRRSEPVATSQRGAASS
jgi:hypothetical protein